MLHKAISKNNKLKYNLDKKRLQIQAKNFDCSQKTQNWWQLSKGCLQDTGI